MDIHTNITNIKQLIEKIPWMRPMLYIINKFNLQSCLMTICLSLAVNQKYFPILKAVLELDIIGRVLNFDELAMRLIIESTYLDIATVSKLLNFSNWNSIAYKILQKKPTKAIYTELKTKLNHQVIINTFAAPLLESGNEELILDFVKSFNVRLHTMSMELRLCQLNNVLLIEAFAEQYQSDKNAKAFFYRQVAYHFAVLNNVPLFQLFDEKVEHSADDIESWFTDAVIAGSTDIVKLGLSLTNRNIQETDQRRILDAYYSGSTSMVELLMQYTVSAPNMKVISHDFFISTGFLHRNPRVRFNPVLLRDLLSHYSNVATISKTVHSILLDENYRFEDVTEEIFQILAEFAPDLSIRLQGSNTERMRWCLKYFKKTQLTNYATKHQVLEMIKDGILEPDQFPSNGEIEWSDPEAKKSVAETVLDLVNLRRTVYLYFAAETELRDNAELILSYIDIGDK